MLVGLDEQMVANKPHLLQSRRSQSSYGAGRFHLSTDANETVTLHGLNNDFVYLYAHMNASSGFQIDRNYGNHYNSSNLAVERLTLDYDGNMRVYRWESKVNSSGMGNRR